MKRTRVRWMAQRGASWLETLSGNRMYTTSERPVNRSGGTVIASMKPLRLPVFRDSGKKGGTALIKASLAQPLCRGFLFPSHKYRDPFSQGIDT